MFHENLLRKKLLEGSPTLSTRLHSMSPLIAEAVGALHQYDYIEFVGEYAPYDQYGMENLVRAAEVHGMASMMKADFHNRAYVAQKSIASGFQAVLFTDHTTPEQIEESIKCITPMCPQKNGTMGYAARRWIEFQNVKTQDEYIDMVCQTVKAFMVEKKSVVDDLDSFLSVPGIDMVQFGPNDYALSAGINMADHKDLIKNVEKKVILACHDHGIRPRVELNSAADAEFYLDLGVKDFSLGLEMRILQGFLEKEGDLLMDMLAKNNIL